MRLPRYRVWAGLGLWTGATVADAIWCRCGYVSFAGFATAFFWSLRAPSV